MSKTMLMNFLVDKENKKINVERDFEAPVDLVWQAWTTPEILDQWWAPRPYRTETKSMDFREGGKWHYSMVSPEDQRHWCLFEYYSIDPQKRYSGLDAFCDENANISSEMPRMNWHNTFNENGDSTTVKIEIRFNDVADMEKIVEMGFKEGFSMATNNLDEWLAANRK
jgi:uncharacterized protein YndB with AHSA1/START domain